MFNAEQIPEQQSSPTICRSYSEAAALRFRLRPQNSYTNQTEKIKRSCKFVFPFGSIFRIYFCFCCLIGHSASHDQHQRRSCQNTLWEGSEEVFEGRGVCSPAPTLVRLQRPLQAASLQQVGQLVLEVLGVLHTAGQRHVSVLVLVRVSGPPG